jgi:tetratricopeptide (TPR) repeat protein
LLGSKDDFTYNTNGHIKRYQLKNYEGAIKDYTKAYELNPKYHDAYLKNRGDLYAELKNYKAALADFELLNKLDPTNEEYKEMLRLLKEKLKQ